MIRINKYDVIKLENKGQYGYQITLGYEDRDGEFKPKFCKREFGKNNEKTVPVSISLGEKPVTILKALLSQVTGNAPDDPPF